MKRELKAVSLTQMTTITVVEEPFPMKRELKAQAARGGNMASAS